MSKKKVLSAFLCCFAWSSFSSVTIAETVSFVPGNSDIYFPTRTSGDCETGKDPLMDATASLDFQGRNVYVDIYYRTYEYDHDQSSARVIDRELIWTAPSSIKRIIGPTSWSIKGQVDSSRNTAVDYTPGGSSPWFFRMEARTLGTDFADCGPSPHSYFQLIPRGDNYRIFVELD